MSADKTQSSQALSQPSCRERFRTLTPLSDEEHETEAYNALLDEGGRPLYPITLLELVSKNPENYQEMLRPWLALPDVNPPEWEVFMKQLRNWKAFRRWQKYNREDLSNWGDQRFVEVEFAYNNFVRAFRYEYPEYTEAVKQLLEQHGFTQSFQFHEDPGQQDKLTTWIEYLGFEYWQLEWSTRSIKRLQPKYEAAWKLLVDSRVLRLDETAEFLRTDESGFRCESEREQAEKAIESAKSAAGDVLILTERARNDPHRSELTQPERVRMLAEAQSRLDAAQASLNSIRRRSDLIIDFVRGTWDNETAKKDAEHHSILVRWIMEQLPSVDAELKSSKVTEDCSSARRGTKRRCTYHQRDGLRNDRNPKKQRGNDQSSCSDVRAVSTTQAKGRPKRSRPDDAIEDERSSKRFKDGGQDSNYLHKTIGGTSRMLVGKPQQPETPTATEQNGGDNLVLKHANVRLLRSGISRSPVIPRQLRRSARIAAHRDTARVITGPLHSVKSSC